MERQYGHGFTETDTDERKRKAGHQAFVNEGVIVIREYIKYRVDSACELV